MKLAEDIWAANFADKSQSYRLVGIQMTNLTDNGGTIKKMRKFAISCPLCIANFETISCLDAHITSNCPFIQKSYKKNKVET